MSSKKSSFTKEELEIIPFNVLDHLKTDEDMALYLEASLEEGGPELFFTALGDVIKAKGIAQIAKETGLSREGLYKTFEPGRQPQFDTVWKITRALGLAVSIGCRRMAGTNA
jgi:probable addiction module antidote protein